MPTTCISLLATRQSSAKLTPPAPSAAELDQLFLGALRAPDHAQLRPWRYLVIEGEGLRKLGDVFVQAAETAGGELVPEQRQRMAAMPLRAPMVIVGVVRLVEHPKVPHIEQTISAGVGMGYLLLGLQSLGYGGMWRTGDMAYSREVMTALGLAADEAIVGFLYVGTPTGTQKPLSELRCADYVSVWPRN